MFCSIPKEPAVTVDAHTSPITDTLAACSPLEGYVVALTALGSAATARVLPLQRAYKVRTDPEGEGATALATALGTSLPTSSRWQATNLDGTVLWLGPDEWLIIDPTNSDTLEATLRNAVLETGGSVVEQSGQRVSILVGGDASGLLAKGTALDLHPAIFSLGSAVQTFLGQAV